MDATLYMAKLMIGSSASFTGMIIPMSEGDKEGKLIISYQDNSNQEVVEEYPFSVNVTDMDEWGFPEDGMFPDDRFPFDDGGGEPAYLRFLKANWIAVSLGVIVLIQFIAIIRIKRKAKEDFFDE